MFILILRIMLALIGLGGILSASGIIFGQSLPSLQIAYQSSRNDRIDIYLLDIGRGIESNLTKHLDTDHMAPSWSPDGRHIVFAKRLGDWWDLHIMTATGRDLRRLTYGPRTSYLPAWSPRGDLIAYTTDRHGNWEIYVYDLLTDTEHRVTENNVTDNHPAWSPDGAYIIYTSMESGTDDLYLIRPDGTGKHQITDDIAREGTPSFSPDGARITWVSERTPTNQCLIRNDRTIGGQRCILHVDVFVMNRDGTEAIRLTRRTGRYYSPVFSPDGSMIAYAGADPMHRWHIYLVHPDGTGHIRLTRGAERNNFPSWRPFNPS